MVAIDVLVGGVKDHRRSMLRATFEDETRCEAVLLGSVCDLKVQSWRVQYQSSSFLLFMTSANKNDQVIYHSRANRGVIYKKAHTHCRAPSICLHLRLWLTLKHLPLRSRASGLHRHSELKRRMDPTHLWQRRQLGNLATRRGQRLLDLITKRGSSRL